MGTPIPIPLDHLSESSDLVVLATAIDGGTAEVTEIFKGKLAEKRIIIERFKERNNAGDITGELSHRNTSLSAKKTYILFLTKSETGNYYLTGNQLSARPVIDGTIFASFTNDEITIGEFRKGIESLK